MTDQRLSRLNAFVDLAIVIGVLLVLKSVLLTAGEIWIYAGPISLLVTFAVASILLRVRQQDWARVGLKSPTNYKWTALWVVVAFVVTIAAGIGAEMLTTSFLPEPSAETQAIDERYSGRFENLPGNLPVFLMWLAIAWVIGGFVEEMLFRGFLFDRFEQLFMGVPAAAIIAVLCQAVLFGQQHFYYQGLTGWVATGVIAFVSGVLFLLFKRNLWPLIISHGLANTLGMTLMFLGPPN